LSRTQPAHEVTAMSNTPASPERGALRGADLFQHEAYDRHREALAAAVQDGLGVDLFVTPGNELHPVQHHWRLWVPWESARGQSFKAVGAKDGYMDHAVAIADARQQFVCWSEALPRMPRFFRLVRLEDVSGVSGVGHIADGVQWHDRSVPLRWRTSPNSTGFYNSMEDVQAVGGGANGGSRGQGGHGVLRGGVGTHTRGPQLSSCHIAHPMMTRGCRHRRGPGAQRATLLNRPVSGRSACAAEASRSVAGCALRSAASYAPRCTTSPPAATSGTRGACAS
jgi:hypothetical protein